jgi:hypothetical protein
MSEKGWYHVNVYSLSQIKMSEEETRRARIGCIQFDQNPIKIWIL